MNFYISPFGLLWYTFGLVWIISLIAFVFRISHSDSHDYGLEGFFLCIGFLLWTLALLVLTLSVGYFV